MDLPTGTLLGGRYRVEALLGSGGMGSIYSAVQEGLNRRVALKVLHQHLASESDLLERFKREARSIAALGHPNVVQVNDFQTNPGEPPFIVMELLQGESLSAAIAREGQLTGERVAFIAMQVLSALAAAHNADIVHRDIKPDNIFLSATSVQSDLVKVLDFGVAKVLRDEKDPKLTRSGHFLGTLSYTAPEQARGAPIDARVDLYALGACMYVALAGRKPFDAPNMPQLVGQILNDRPVPLAAIRTDLDRDLCAIVLRALEKKPADRFASAEEMAAALERFAAPTPAAARSSRPLELPSSRGSLVPTARDHAPPSAPSTRRDGPRSGRALDLPALTPLPLLEQSGATEPPAGGRPAAFPSPAPPEPSLPALARAGTVRMMAGAPAVTPKATLVSGPAAFRVPSLPPMEPTIVPSSPLSSASLDGEFDPPTSPRAYRSRPRAMSPLMLILAVVSAIGLLLLGAVTVLVGRKVADSLGAAPQHDAGAVRTK
jgi:serine/threonine-protein kinase